MGIHQLVVYHKSHRNLRHDAQDLGLVRTPVVMQADL
jgi:hypothetical protein